MPGSLRSGVQDAVEPFRTVLRDRDLRRLQLAFVGSVIGDWSYGIALSVFIYERAGLAAVGLLQLCRLIPAAVAAPFTAVLVDRFPRARVLAVTDVIRAAVVAGILVLATIDAPAAAVYVLAGVTTVTATAFEPALRSLLPSLADTPEALTAANATSTTVESAASFVGPALAGLAVGALGVEPAFVLPLAAFLWSAVLVRGIRPRASSAEAGDAMDGEEAASKTPGRLAEIGAGFQLLRRDSRVRVVMALLVAQIALCGVITVVMVAATVDLLGMEASGVGLLFSGLGIGGLLGAVPAMAVIGRTRLTTATAIGLVLWGVPFALVGVVPEPAFALACFVLIGVGNTLVDVAGLTLLQRVVPDAVMGRVFGVFESLILVSMAATAAVTPPLVEAVGLRWTFVVTGLALPVLTLLLWRPFRAADPGPTVRPEQLALLRGVPMLGSLPPAVLERLGGQLVTVPLQHGQRLFAAGDPGDRFYVIADGQVEVAVEGAGTRLLDAGDAFGEIALLRDTSRTATITATAPTTLWALERDPFIAAVTGHAPSAAAADEVIARRLGALRPAVGSI